MHGMLDCRCALGCCHESDSAAVCTRRCHSSYGSSRTRPTQLRMRPARRKSRQSRWSSSKVGDLCLVRLLCVKSHTSCSALQVSGLVRESHCKGRVEQRTCDSASGLDHEFTKSAAHYVTAGHSISTRQDLVHSNGCRRAALAVGQDLVAE
jgi:hypothetical protein